MPVISSLMTGTLIYFLDAERGKRRRYMARDHVFARMRRLARGMRGLARGAAAETHGVSHRIIHLVARPTEIPDDETLRQRVESQLFRDRHIPKGDLNISCEHGMVILRGELDRPLQIEELQERVARMPGARGVQSLLHTHGTPAPNKQRSLYSG